MSRPRGTAASSTAQVAGPTPWCRRGVGIAAASSAASISARDLDRLVGVLRARLDEDAVHRRMVARAARAAAPHRHEPALGERLGVARGPDARLDADPALREQVRPARASPPRRSSARRGRAARSSPRSPRPRVDVAAGDPQAGRQRELDARAGAARARPPAVCAGSSVSCPSASRGWTWIEVAPAATHARASASNSSGVRGTPDWRSPFRQAWRTRPCHRGGHRGQQRRADQERPAGADQRDQRERGGEVADQPARRGQRVQPAGDVARARRRVRTRSRIAHGESAPSTSTGGATSTSSASSEPASSSSESSVAPSSGIATSGISATSPAPSSAARAIPGACGWRSASRPPSQ